MKPYWSWTLLARWLTLPVLLWYSKRNFLSHVWYQDDKVTLRLEQTCYVWYPSQIPSRR